MFRFGMAFGSKPGTITCPPPQGEMLYNRHFACGMDGWAPVNNANIIVEPPSYLRIEATEEHSGLRYDRPLSVPAGQWHIAIAVTEITGTGHVAYHYADGSQHTAITFDTVGTHAVDITTDQEIVGLEIMANNDATFNALLDGISLMDATVVHYPDWWAIDSLDDADILGAWDMIWPGATDSATARTPLAGSMPYLETVAGGPGLTVGRGIMFGGGGCLASDLPAGLDFNNISVLLQIDGVLQNATLDAMFSHYTSGSHFTLQNGWGGDGIRWSCGDGSSTTVATGSVITSGVVAVSGRRLYRDGVFQDEVPESGPSATDGYRFHLGAILLEDGRIVQFMRGYVQRLLIVGRLLTDDEQQQLYSNMTGAATGGSDMDGDGLPDERLLDLPNGGSVTYDDDSVNIDIDGDGKADIVIER